MNKTIEAELAPHYAKVNKALDGLEKVFEKFVHGMSEEQRTAAIEFLEDRVERTTSAMRRAGQNAQGFSFSAARPRQQTAPAAAPTREALDSARAAQPQPLPAAPSQAVTTAFVRVGDDVMPAPEGAIVLPAKGIARPIGRLAADANEPNAGAAVFADPIRSAPPRGLVEDGVGFLTKNNRGEDVLA